MSATAKAWAIKIGITALQAAAKKWWANHKAKKAAKKAAKDGEVQAND